MYPTHTTSTTGTLHFPPTPPAPPTARTTGHLYPAPQRTAPAVCSPESAAPCPSSAPVATPADPGAARPAVAAAGRPALSQPPVPTPPGPRTENPAAASASAAAHSVVAPTAGTAAPGATQSRPQAGRAAAPPACGSPAAAAAPTGPPPVQPAERAGQTAPLRPTAEPVGSQAAASAYGVTPKASEGAAPSAPPVAALVDGGGRDGHTAPAAREVPPPVAAPRTWPAGQGAAQTAGTTVAPALGSAGTAVPPAGREAGAPPPTAADAAGLAPRADERHVAARAAEMPQLRVVRDTAAAPAESVRPQAAAPAYGSAGTGAAPAAPAGREANGAAAARTAEPVARHAAIDEAGQMTSAQRDAVAAVEGAGTVERRGLAPVAPVAEPGLVRDAAQPAASAEPVRPQAAAPAYGSAGAGAAPASPLGREATASAAVRPAEPVTRHAAVHEAGQMTSAGRDAVGAVAEPGPARDTVCPAVPAGPVRPQRHGPVFASAAEAADAAEHIAAGGRRDAGQVPVAEPPSSGSADPGHSEAMGPTAGPGPAVTADEPGPASAAAAGSAAASGAASAGTCAPASGSVASAPAPARVVPVAAAEPGTASVVDLPAGAAAAPQGAGTAPAPVRGGVGPAAAGPGAAAEVARPGSGADDASAEDTLDPAAGSGQDTPDPAAGSAGGTPAPGSASRGARGWVVGVPVRVAVVAGGVALPPGRPAGEAAPLSPARLRGAAGQDPDPASPGLDIPHPADDEAARRRGIVAQAVTRGMPQDPADDTPDPPRTGPARGVSVTEVPVHLPFLGEPRPAPDTPKPADAGPKRTAPAPAARPTPRPAPGRRVPRGDDRLHEHHGPVLPGWVGVGVGALALAGCLAVLWRAGVVPAAVVAAFGATPRAYHGLRATHWPPLAFLGIVALLALGGLGRGKAGHAWVLTLFGRYRGTVRRTGLTWVSPLLLRRRVDVRLRHWRSDPMPAVDAGGLALQVVVQVVWQVKDTARATLAVADHTEYLAEQVESAMARVLSQLPADAFHEDAPTLRDAEAVGDALTRMLACETEAVGIEVYSAQPTRIEYAPEVAEAMRRRRVAAIDAKHRDTVLTSIVDAVDDTVHRLTSRGLVELDDYERKALVKDLTVAFYTGRPE